MTKETPIEETKEVKVCRFCKCRNNTNQKSCLLCGADTEGWYFSNKLPNKEECGEIFCKKCGLPKSTWGTIPYPYPPCSHEVSISPSDKTLEEWNEPLEELIGDIRMNSSVDSVHIHEFVRSLLTSATIKAKKEVLKELGYEAHEYNATSWIERKAKSLGINLEDK